MLTVDKIDVCYGDLQVLWNVSLKVNEGEIVALIGPNGAGKTTLLKTLSGLLRSRSGNIHFLGKCINNLPPHRIVELGLVQVPEGKRSFQLLSVLENLKVGAYTRIAREKRDQTMEWVFQLFPILKERKNQLAGTLSGGELQMLAIGRSLMAKPKLLMLDEPSSGLAPKLVLKVFEALRKIKEEGCTLLFVEQNVYNALRLSVRTYVLETGKIVLEGLSKELLEDNHVKRAYLGGQ